MSDQHQHDFGGMEWPFSDPVLTASLTTVRVVDDALPILLVAHDDDDGLWQMLCGTTNDPEDGLFVCLGCLFERDPSLGEVADLPAGWWAWRERIGAPWQRAPRSNGKA